MVAGGGWRGIPARPFRSRHPPPSTHYPKGVPDGWCEEVEVEEIGDEEDGRAAQGCQAC